MLEIILISENKASQEVSNSFDCWFLEAEGEEKENWD